MDSRLPPYRVLEEPPLAFDPNQTAVHEHPLRGLLIHGPYSSRVHSLLGIRIRIATIGPAGSYGHIAALLHQLNVHQRAQERPDYLPDYPGGAAAFGVEVAQVAEDLRAELPSDLRSITRDSEPGPALASALLDIVRRLHLQRDRFDVVAIYLPSAWSEAFRSEDGFDLHDAVKAGAAGLGVPTQLLNDEVWTYRCRASVAWRLLTALYSKYGGSPWRIARSTADTETAFIGLAYARKGRQGEGRFAVCCSQVFDADGGGMQFVAFDVGDGVDLRNPILHREQMRMIMARSLALYQRRNGGALPGRVVVHKTSSFSEDELRGVSDALAAVREIDCVQVQASVPWRAVKLNPPPATPRPGPPSRADGYPVLRGTFVHLSGRACLLWAGGNAPNPETGRNYFQGGNSIPGPLLLTRFAGSGELERLARETLALTKMDWNNDALYDPVPVTIKYSQTLARVVAHGGVLENAAYPYRLFM